MLTSAKRSRTPSPQPTVLVPLYMHGMTVDVSKGTVIKMAPVSTAEHKILTVVVQGISFIISKDMVLQNDRLPHLLPKRGLPMADNYFAQALKLHDDKDLIEIDDRARDIIGQAKFYPMVFDYLRRRLHSSSAPLCMHHMEPDDAIDLHAVLDALFMTKEEDKLPMTADGRQVYVAVVGVKLLERANSHTECCNMGIDPRFVRLVREIKNPAKSTDPEAKTRRKEMLRRLCEDYEMHLEWKDINETTIETIPRGQRFVIDTEDDDEFNSKYETSVAAMAVLERWDYHCA